MKNINKFILVCMMITLGSVNIYTGILGGDPSNGWMPGHSNKVRLERSLEINDRSINTSHMTGTYYKNNGIVTIKQRYGPLLYTFTNVVASPKEIEGLTFLGSYMHRGVCPKVIGTKCKSLRKVNLYGSLNSERQRTGGLDPKPFRPPVPMRP